MTPIFYSFSKRYAYDPETGEMLDGVMPVTALWKAGQSKVKSLRVRLGRNSEHGDVTEKAETLAMMFITGGELAHGAKVLALDGDPQNLKASNLYAYREDPALKRPGQTTPGREVLLYKTQIPLAAALMVDGDTATPHGDALRLHGRLNGTPRALSFEDPVEGVKTDYLVHCASRFNLLVPEYLDAHKFDPADFAIWCTAQRAQRPAPSAEDNLRAQRFMLERIADNLKASASWYTQLAPDWKDYARLDARRITAPELIAERDALLAKLDAPIL